MGYLDEKGLARFWLKIKNALSKKQDVLSAGNGITIEKRGGALTISATEGSSGGGIYSTEETRIGTWIDGKPLYRKTVILKVTGDNTTVPAFEYEELVNAYGSGTAKDTKSLIPNAESTVYLNNQNIIVYLGRANVGTDLIITLEYTKSTD